MGFFNRPKKDKRDNPYIGLRQQVFTLKKTQEMETSLEGHPIFAAVVDMDMGSAIVSLICVADGTTSLYFSNGGGQMGLGHADEKIRTASIAFLRSADQVLEIMDKTEEYPLPQNGKHLVYLLTSDGLYKKELDMKTVDEESKEIRFLNFLYQNVLSKIGEYTQSAK